MSDIIDIIRENNSTFYDYRTGKATAYMRRFYIFFILAFVLPLVISLESERFIESIITTFSILIGFSFTVMFYIVSNPTMQTEKRKDESLERQLAIKKLQTLNKEIFHNISYFNVISIALLIVSVILFVDYGNTAQSAMQILNLEYEKYVRKITYLDDILWHIISFVFMFLLIEGTFTFTRTILRVKFIFSEKLRLQNESP